MSSRAYRLAFFLLSGSILLGCTGTRTFHDEARAGDTVSISAGWMHHFQRKNITVTITDSNGVSTTYAPGNQSVRASVNLYPDPLSSLLVSPEVGVDLTPNAQFNAGIINDFFTRNDKDLWESVVFIDLPPSMSLGEATVNISNTLGESITSSLSIVGGTGSPNTFPSSVDSGGGGSPFYVTSEHMLSLERIDHHTVIFSGGASTPYAIQLKLTHDATGTAYVVNPRGDLKNVTWSDDGTTMNVIVMSNRPSAVAGLLDLKFYITGNVNNLAIVPASVAPGSVEAFDINGNPISGVSASIAND